mmetsp:Transcript_19409/g.45919  ORF Transcript_19409/g.45919 Transcript_19409/m.45919 type:complete len:209 (-) Transcript_19409:233-859(-)
MPALVHPVYEVLEIKLVVLLWLVVHVYEVSAQSLARHFDLRLLEVAIHRELGEGVVDLPQLQCAEVSHQRHKLRHAQEAALVKVDFKEESADLFHGCLVAKGAKDLSQLCGANLPRAILIAPLKEFADVFQLFAGEGAVLPEDPHEVKELIIVELAWDGGSDHLDIDVQHGFRQRHVVHTLECCTQLLVADGAFAVRVALDDKATVLD